MKRVDWGKLIEMVDRSLDVTAADVSRRQERADNVALGALKSNQRDAKDLEIDSLCSNVGELIMIIEFRDEKIERLEAGRPFVRLEVKAMSVVVSASEKKHTVWNGSARHGG
ncbi:MAG: hypothetical protein ISN28_12470 [Ectothiorhodospiraceae bacterium AqS1]|nr:hypothetical protein [Ectothiorhodospiraceae bacterium AqS1]